LPGAVDKQNDRVNVKWFRDVVVRAALDRLDGGLHVPDSGRQHDNNGSAIGRSPFLSGSYPSGHSCRRSGSRQSVVVDHDVLLGLSSRRPAFPRRAPCPSGIEEHRR